MCKVHEVAEIDGKTCIAMEHVSDDTPVASCHRDLKPSHLILLARSCEDANLRRAR